MTEYLLAVTPVQGAGCAEVNTYSIPALIPNLVRVIDSCRHKHIPTQGMVQGQDKQGTPGQDGMVGEAASSSR